MNPDDAVQRWISESDNAFNTATTTREGPYESWETTKAYPATEAPLSFDEGESFDPFRGLEVGGPDQREGFSEGFTARADQWSPEAAPPYEMEGFTEVVSEEPHEALVGEMLDEEAVTSACLESASPSVSSYDVASEQFTGIEHKTIGDAGSGGAKSILMYGAPPRQLTFGDVVALSGDYFGEYSEMTGLSATAAGRMQLAWARWDCLSGPGFSEPEPQVDAPTRKAVQDRYYQLASVNYSHFSEPGGTAWATYTKWHGTAVAAAFEAGSRRDPQQWLLALTREAFADHYLTDSFSAGHVRTPRITIKEWYGRQFPGGSEPLVRYMSRHLYRTLDAQGRLPWLLHILEGRTRHVIEGKIRKLGGEALGTFTLGDIVSKALHDYDNAHGLAVVTDVDASGKAHPGGYVWMAIGDAHLATSKYGPETRAMAVAAVAASIRDLQRVRDAGTRAGPGPHSSGRAAELVRLALGAPIFEARRYVPREKPGDARNPAIVGARGTRAPLEWRWGQLGPLAYQGVDTTVKGDIVAELTKLSNSIDDSVSKFGMTVRGIRAAYNAFVQHLRNDGITALEAAMGQKAR
jgi:hypothetical protein